MKCHYILNNIIYSMVTSLKCVVISLFSIYPFILILLLLIITTIN